MQRSKVGDVRKVIDMRKDPMSISPGAVYPSPQTLTLTPYEFALLNDSVRLAAAREARGSEVEFRSLSSVIPLATRAVDAALREDHGVSIRRLAIGQRELLLWEFVSRFAEVRGEAGRS
jgi:hypothetical protein